MIISWFYRLDGLSIGGRKYDNETFGALDAELLAVIPKTIELSPLEFTLLLMELRGVDRFTDGTAES
jgi:hypothetical protein